LKHRQQIMNPHMAVSRSSATVIQVSGLEDNMQFQMPVILVQWIPKTGR
jgi:hypothetical protein